MPHSDLVFQEVSLHSISTVMHLVAPPHCDKCSTFKHQIGTNAFAELSYISINSIIRLWCVLAASSRALLADQILASDLPNWRSNSKNLDAQAAVLWGQVISAVQVSGYNLVKPPGARGASRDWVRDGMRMQRYAVVAFARSTVVIHLHSDTLIQ